jgi:5'-nucleotidase
LCPGLDRGGDCAGSEPGGMIVRRLLVIALAVAVVASGGPALTQTAVPAGSVTIKLIALNDFHGYIAPSETARLPVTGDPGKTVTEPVGGVAYLATAIRQLAAQNPLHAVVGAGDMVGASPLNSALFHDEPTIESLGAAGLEYTSVGNHEFDEGKVELLRKQNGGCRAGGTIGKDTCLNGTFAGAKFKYLAANVIDQSTGKTLFPAYAIKQFDIGNGKHIGIAFVGVILKDTPSVTTAAGVRGVTFADEADTINALLPQIAAQGVHAVVVLIHQGITNKGSGATCSGPSGDLLPILDKLDPSIALVISGHTHRAYICPHGEGTQHSKVFYTSAGRFGQMLSNIDVTVDTATDTITGVRAVNESVVNDVTPNPAPASFTAFAPEPVIARNIALYLQATAPLVNRVVGHIAADFTNSPLESGLPVDATSGESSMGDLIADSRLEATQSFGAVAAFINPGGIRSVLRVRALDGSKTPGDVTYGETYSAAPFGDLLYTETLNGTQIYDLLAEQWLNKKSGQILGVSRGFTYTWDAHLPDGSSKVIPGSVMIGGHPVVPNGAYRITIDSFLADGGDEFTVLRNGSAKVAGEIDRDALNEYITKHSPVAPAPHNRIIRKN